MMHFLCRCVKIMTTPTAVWESWEGALEDCRALSDACLHAELQLKGKETSVF